MIFQVIASHKVYGGRMKKNLLFLRNTFELYIPIFAFIVMFATFIVQVFFRYVIRYPLTWTIDIIVISFIWAVEFGACYTMRNKAHVKFTMLYDRFKPKTAALTRLIGNLVIILTFISLIPASWAQTLFQNFQKTPALRISYSVMFMPFVYFLIAIICYSAPEILEDIKVLKGLIPDSKDHAESLEAITTVEAKK